MTKRTNYLEAVGLILVGFSLYETIYTKAQTTLVAAEWGLTKNFDQNRIIVIAIVCLAVAISLALIQAHKEIPVRPPTSISDAVKQLSDSFFLDWKSKLAPIGLGMQFFAVASVWNMFGAQAATALLIGFLFVNAGIFAEKMGWL